MSGPHPSVVRALVLGAVALAAVLTPLLATPAQDERDLAPKALDDNENHYIIPFEVVAVACPAGYDNHHDDDICLAYNGQVPGPTFTFEQGDLVTIHLTNRIAATIEAVDGPQSVKDELRHINVSLHRHGIRVTEGNDGIFPAPGSNMSDSTVGPDMTRTYQFRTEFEGAWHYHDHVMFGNTVHGTLERGLFGSYITVPYGSTSNSLDLHLLDAGPNGGLGLGVTLPAGERFDINVVGLGNYPWTARLVAPDQTLVDERMIGPGVSRQMTVEHAVAGVYTWSAESAALPGLTWSGEVVIQ